MREAERLFRLWSHGRAQCHFFLLVCSLLIQLVEENVATHSVFCCRVWLHFCRCNQGVQRRCVWRRYAAVQLEVYSQVFPCSTNMNSELNPKILSDSDERIAWCTWRIFLHFSFFGNITNAPLRCWRLFQPAKVNAAFHSEHSPSSRLVLGANGKQGRTSIAPLCSELTAGRLSQPVAPYLVQRSHGNLWERNYNGAEIATYVLEEMTELVMGCLNVKQKKTNSLRFH